MRRTVIIGIDPGVTAAYAVLDTDGNVVRIRSGKDLTKNRMINDLAHAGDVAIVASDVNPAPVTVHAISAAFSAKLVYPPSDMSVDEKTRLAKLGGKTRNLHERDALGAAFRAYKDHRDLIERIKRRSSDDKKERVMKLILSGRVNRITTALGMLELKRETPAHRVFREEQEKRKPKFKIKPRRYKTSIKVNVEAPDVNILKPEKPEEPFNKQRFTKWLDRYRKKKER